MLQKFFNAIVATIVAVAFCACTNYSSEDTRTASTTDEPEHVVTKDNVMVPALTHNLDTTATSATDNMTAEMTVYVREDGTITDSVKFTANPVMKANIYLSKNDYVITEDMLESRLTASSLRRSFSENNDVSLEKDTLLLSFNDGQLVSVPVSINCYSRTVGSDKFYFGSDSLLSGELVKVWNTPVASTRATYVAEQVMTTYLVKLTFEEKNMQRKARFDVLLQASALRKIVAEDAIDQVEVINKDRIVLDATTERISFDKVITMKSGDVLTENNSYILNRECKIIDPYEKFVSSFAYQFDKSNGIVSPAEQFVKADGNWSVYGKSDKYSANISNKVAAELITTDYTLYHERATYKDSFVEVEFGYEDMNVTEVKNNVLNFDSDKEGYDKAIFTNAIKATYLDYVHDLAEEVYLYMPARSVSGYEITDTNLEVKDDKVIATLTFTTKYSDGTEEKSEEKAEFPVSVTVLTDWYAEVVNSAQETDTCKVVLSGTNTKSEGYWSYTQETRNISTLVKLAGGLNSEVNRWKVISPNNITFTREGKSYQFPAIAFTATEAGAKVVLKSNENSVATYSYTDNLNVALNDHQITSVAPGTIVVDNSAAVEYGYRDQKMIITDDAVTVKFVFVSKYYDNTEKTEDISKSFPRSLTCTTNWTSYEQNSKESTSAVRVAMTSSEDVEEGNWLYVNETRSLTSIVTLDASSQNNIWTSVDPNNIRFVRQGVVINFGEIAYSAAVGTHNATLRNTVKNVDTYDYTCNIAVTFGSNVKNSAAPGTIVVEKEKEAIDHNIIDKDIVVNDDDVTVTFTYVTSYNDDSETTEKVTKSFPRSLTCITNWATKEDNADQTTGMASASLENGISKADGFWRYEEETYKVNTFANLNASMQMNAWTAVVPNNFVYVRDGKTYEIGSLQLSAAQKDATVTLKSESSVEEVYAYEDVINVMYGNNTLRTTAPGQITVAKEIVVIGYDITNQKLEVNDNNVTASLTWVTKYSDGTEKSENLSKVLARSLSCTSNWKSVEDNSNQTTGAAGVTLGSSTSKADGNWSWNEETRNISTIATLAGSSQTNSWVSVDPNAIVYTREGKTYNFGSLAYNAQETGASVKVTEETADATVYAYTDGITVTYGSNAVKTTAPGQISVETPWVADFPAAWGKFVKAVATCSINEAGTDWVYVWSLHFENGTLPVILRKDDTAANINQSLYENLTDARLNSASYISGKWINSIATDEKNVMSWTGCAGNSYNMIQYSTSTMWKWNYGKNSVFTDKFSFAIENGGKVLTVKKDGNVFATYKAAK